MPPSKPAKPAAPPKLDYESLLQQAILVRKTDNPLNVPYDIALAEAVTAGNFVKKYWERAGTRPGLRSSAKRLPLWKADQTVAFVRAVQEAQTRLILLVDPVVANKGERARFVIDELESAIEFLLDDGVEEPADQQLAQIREFHAQDGQRSSVLSQALRDYACLARELQDRLVEIDEEFEVELIDEAEELADELSVKPAGVAANSVDVANATRVRNQFLHLMHDNVRLIRKTAAHVFRRHPEIVREVSSAYERRRRAAARRAKKNQGEPKGGPK